MVNRIVEVDNHHLHEYSGNFAAYVVEKQLRFKTLQKQFVHEAELLAYEAEGIASRREAARNKGTPRSVRTWRAFARARARGLSIRFLRKSMAVFT